MKVLFRVDSSQEIGTGHISRCLTLAKELRENGHHVEFIVKALVGNITKKIIAENFIVHSIYPETGYLVKNPDIELKHSQWLKSSQKNDAMQCMSILKKTNPHLIIVDHYALDQQWEKIIRSEFCGQIMIIDDLCDRMHVANFLIDATYGRSYTEYQGMINEDCRCHFGPDYAIIDRRFKALQEKALRKRKKTANHYKILITMGGVDINNISSRILDILTQLPLIQVENITLIIGGASPHKLSLMQKCTSLNIQFLIDVNDMPQIMLEHDIAIGALGVTVWERCVLCLPAINICIAENQNMIAEKIKTAGLTVIKAEEIAPVKIETLLSEIMNDYFSACEIAGNACSGDGIKNILSLIAPPSNSLSS